MNPPSCRHHHTIPFWRFEPPDCPAPTTEHRGLSMRSHTLDKDATKPYKFIWFGDIHGLKPYKFIGFGAMDVTSPYKFIWTGDIHGFKPYEFIGFRFTHLGQRCPVRIIGYAFCLLGRGRRRSSTGDGKQSCVSGQFLLSEGPWPRPYPLRGLSQGVFKLRPRAPASAEAGARGLNLRNPRENLSKVRVVARVPPAQNPMNL
jgi:hypothetical protein